MRRLILKLLRRRRLDQDLDAELAFHREMSATGGNPIPFGHTASIKEQALDLWRFTLIENLWRDLMYGARGLRRRPVLLLTAVASLALGIGANTAVFSVAVEFLLSHPSVTDSGSLVYVRLGGNSHSPHEVLDAIRDSGVVADVAGENEETFINWNDGTETHRIFTVVTTKNYFSALGVPLAMGRGFVSSDPDDVVVLAHDFWRRAFDADASVVGRTIRLDGRPYTVAGILPASHRTLIGYGHAPDVYVPRYLDNTKLAMYARLKPGMSIGQAEAGLRTVATRLDREMPDPFTKYADPLRVAPIAGLTRLRSDSDATTIGLFFVALLIVVGLVLVIACVNVAGLLLARASTRRREMAIRLSLGASRGRLLQQLLVESLLLSMMGAGCGFALAEMIAALLGRLQLPVPLPIHLHIQPDWRVALYAAGLTILSTLVCGLFPALQSLKESMTSDLQRESKMRLRRVLVAGQIAISFVVLTTGALFLRNLMQASAINPGFDLHHTVRAEVNLPPAAYESSKSINLYAARALEALKVIPGIEAAAAARIVPFTDSARFATVFVFPDTGAKIRASFNWNAVTPDYFHAMDIPVREGRAFLPTDDGASKVLVVNQALARRFLGGRAPVGTELLWGDSRATIPYRIVGVVDGTKNMTIGEGDLPQLYEPLAQIRNDRPRLQFVLRSAILPATQLDTVRRALRDVESGAGIEVATLSSSIGLAFLPSQVGAVLTSAVGAVGLLLVAVGLYGTMAYSVTRRTQEIGLRMAIGANTWDVSTMILFDATRLIVIGMAVGLIIAGLVTRPLAAFLIPGLTPTDPLSFLAVLVAMAVTGLAASWGPARRAAAIDPMISLRQE